MCIHFPAGALQAERPDIPSVFQYSRTSPPEISITMDAASCSLPREFYDIVTPLITVAGWCLTLPRLFCPRKLYAVSKRRRVRGNAARCRKRGSIERGEERENECMTPAYCARSNDIRDIIPASRECLLRFGRRTRGILWSYCTLSSNAVLIKARLSPSRRG